MPPAKASWPPNSLWQNSALFKASKTERLVTFITIGLIVFVAALNILISLIMMVMEKTKDIAVPCRWARAGPRCAISLLHKAC